MDIGAPGQDLGCWDNIFHAVSSNDPIAVEMLITHHQEDVNIIDAFGVTPLHVCATYGYAEVAKVLLKYGAKRSSRDRESGWTPLHRALYHRHVKLAIILFNGDSHLESSGKPSSSAKISSSDQPIYEDNEGLTPLDLLSRSLCDRQSKQRTHRKSTSIMCFGKADFMLGVPLPNSTASIVRPRRIDSLESETIADIVAGKFHSLAMTIDGRVYSWGHGRSGRLGHGNEEVQLEPRMIDALCKVRIRSIAASENHSLALTSDGDVYCWGSDRFGQLGIGGSSGSSDSSPRLLTSPRRVEALKKAVVINIAVGDAHSLCSTEEGDVFAWGSNQHGQLGLKASDGVPSSPFPREWPSSTDSSAREGIPSIRTI